MAKAYARAPVLTVNGSDDGFDGFRQEKHFPNNLYRNMWENSFMFYFRFAESASPASRTP